MSLQSTSISSSAPVMYFDDVCLRFGNKVALQNISLELEAKTFVAIVGPSGCGKSSLLNLATGLLQPTSGRIFFEDEVLNGINSSIGYVPQDDKLIPWFTVLQNVAFPLKVRGVHREEQLERARSALERVGLKESEQLYPHQLSGGMKKRVALARTLVYEPDVILMDEPFGPLDAQTRMILQHQYLLAWENERPLTIFVTHDLVEAIALSDMVIVMTKSPGQIKAIVPVPLERPRDVFQIQRDSLYPQVYGEVWDALKDEIIL